MLIVRSEAEVSELLSAIRNAKLIAMDTETHGPMMPWVKKNPSMIDALTAQLTCLTISINRVGYYVTVHGPDAEYSDDLPGYYVTQILETILSSNAFVAFHNALYDLNPIENFLGKPWRPKKLIDTMILAWLTGSGVKKWQGGKQVVYHGLKALAQKEFNYVMKELDEINIDQEAEKARKDASLREKFPDIYWGDVKPRGTKPLRMQTNRIPTELLAAYATDDAIYTERLAQLYIPKIKQVGYWESYKKVEVPFLYLLHDMYRKGILFDSSLIEQIGREAQEETDMWAKLWEEKVGCNISSSKEVREAVYGRLKAWPTEGATRTKGGSLAVNKKALDGLYASLPEGSLGRELIDIKKAHSKIYKIKTTYTDTLLLHISCRDDRRIRCTMNQTGTGTGRLSSTNPNLQNQPAPRPGSKPIRAAFIAPPGYKVAAFDYSQLEVRLMAHFAVDAALMDFIVSGKDMHAEVAKIINVDRGVAKAGFFAWQYGGREKTIASNLRIPIETARELVNALDTLYSGVVAWRKEISEFCLSTGYVETLLGRRRWLDGIDASERFEKNPAPFLKRAPTFLENSPDYRIRLIEKGIEPDSRKGLLKTAKMLATLETFGAQRQAANTVIQGSGADVAKLSGIQIQRLIRKNSWDVSLINQVHDEWDVEMHNDVVEVSCPQIAEVMSSCVALKVPLAVSYHYGENLYECK